MTNIIHIAILVLESLYTRRDIMEGKMPLIGDKFPR